MYTMSTESVGLASLTKHIHILNCELHFPASFCVPPSYSFIHIHNKGPPKYTYYNQFKLSLTWFKKIINSANIT